ncbi:hypothetical protein [Ruegeria arenilitoris]|uniref:hypothetical protein n=1 Tax=Ruegeria arenilitoris TaxID=1173585 RepID=UPI00147BF39B|nr:hypothetical protein [Ruegeria arenilitoris]
MAMTLSNSISAFAVRGSVVGCNFVAMLAIGSMAEPSTYGAFVFLWSGALLISSLISFGAPLYLLKEMALSQTSGGYSANSAIRLIFVYPALLTAAATSVFLLLGPQILTLVPDLPGTNSTALILLGLLGFLINLNSCMCSLFHGLNLLNTSMFLKDAAPQFIALVSTTFFYLAAEVKLIWMLGSTVALLAALCLTEVLLFLHLNRRAGLINRNGRHGSFTPYYWGGTVTGIAWAQIDILVGAYLMTAEQLGLYNIVRRICNFVTLPLSIATWLTVGKFSRAFQAKDATALQETVRASLILSNGAGAVLALVVIALILPVQNFYNFPPHTNFQPVWGILIVQAVTSLLYAPSTTMAQTSGLEASAMYARLWGIVVYLLLVVILSVWFSGPVLNGVALLAGTLALNVFVWQRVTTRFGIDSSAFSLFRRA